MEEASVGREVQEQSEELAEEGSWRRERVITIVVCGQVSLTKISLELVEKNQSS